MVLMRLALIARDLMRLDHALQGVAFVTDGDEQKARQMPGANPGCARSPDALPVSGDCRRPLSNVKLRLRGCGGGRASLQRQGGRLPILPVRQSYSLDVRSTAGFG